LNDSAAGSNPVAGMALAVAVLDNPEAISSIK